MRQERTTFIVVAALTLALSARAADFYAKDGISDWTVASNFTKDAGGTTDADAAPGESAGQDTVCIPDDYTVNVASTAARDRVNRLKRIRPLSTTSKIIFTVPANETWTNSCPINYNGNGSQSAYYMNGRVLKRGEGELELVTSATFYSGNYNTDYNTQLIAEEGTLILPQACSVNKVYNFGEIAVSNGATLFSAVGRDTYSNLLSGDGLFTNRASGTVWVYLLGHSKMVNSVAVPVTRTFSGTIGGDFFFNCAERLMLTGTANTFNTGIAPFNNNGEGISGKGVVGAAKLGMSGQPSSIGKSGSINFGQTGGPGMLLYLGSGDETCNKAFNINRWASGASILDAGMNGGVTFTGSWGNPGANASYPRTWGMNYFVLQGSNTANACTFTGAMRAQRYLETNYVIGIVKDGPGIWRFSDSAATYPNYDRLGLGNFVIKDGVFQFASMSRRYECCSLGLATNMTEMYTGVINTNKNVDWFIALGDENDSTREGVLEYVGVNAVCDHDRPLVMRGNARLRNSTAVKVRYRACASEGSNAKTLTLDGSNTAENEISDIIDTAAAPVSVVKEGVGTWVLGGDTTFHGTLDVKGGELIVRKYPSKYSWYRWTIKENTPTTVAPNPSTCVQCSILGLYDSNTNRQNGGLSFVGHAYDLQPGQAGYDSPRGMDDSNGARGIGRLFEDARKINGDGYGMWMFPYKYAVSSGNADSDFTRPVQNSPGSWIPVVMRLAANANPVTSWDYVIYPGVTSGDKAASNRGVKISSMEGSVDGLHWDNLTGGDKVVLESELPGNSYCWVAGGRSNRVYVDGNAAIHQYGDATKVQFPAWSLAKTAPDRAFEVLSNCESVSVAGGSLIADGEGIALRSIVADCAASAGTVDGFTLPNDFEIEVKNLSGHDATLPVSFVNCTGLANAGGWKVTGIVNGRERAMCAFVSGSSVRVSLKGFAVSFR